MEVKSHSFVATNPLNPVGPAEELFISGVSVFEITDFEPPLQRVTIVAINLPDPDTFGPFDSYVATLKVPNPPQSILLQIVLSPTGDESVWAGTGFLTFGGTLPPINVAVKPQSDTRIGPVILQGVVFE